MDLTDPRAIRALAHPLRLDLLELLESDGPATAAACARELDSTQANCSFHLRQLAKYGYVEEAAPGADRRERRWRVTGGPALRVPPGADAAVRRQLERVVLDRETRAVAEGMERRDAEPAPWRDQHAMMSAVAVLTAEEAAGLRERWLELLAPYIARTAGHGPVPPDDRRRVRYFLAATPVPAASGPEGRG